MKLYWTFAKLYQRALVSRKLNFSLWEKGLPLSNPYQARFRCPPQIKQTKKKGINVCIRSSTTCDFVFKSARSWENGAFACENELNQPQREKELSLLLSSFPKTFKLPPLFAYICQKYSRVSNNRT